MVRLSKPKYGFFKNRQKHQFFTYLELRDAAELDKWAEKLQIGQATLTSWIIEEVLRNEDLCRIIMNKLDSRDELADIRALARNYTHDRAVQKGTDLWIECEFCKIKLKADFLVSHMAVCKKNPHFPKLPLITVRRK